MIWRDGTETSALFQSNLHAFDPAVAYVQSRGEARVVDHAAVDIAACLR